MYISFSGYKAFKTCPGQYCFEYPTDEDVIKIPPQNRIGVLYGSTIGTLVEYFYNEKLWRRKDFKEVLMDRAAPTLQSIMEKERQSGGTFHWSKDNYYTSPEMILEDVQNSIPRVIAILKQHKLLGSDAEAEVKLDSYIGGNKIGGRADVKLTRVDYNDLVIYDGKGSRHRDQYVDVRQLYWYAMLYENKFGRLPDKLAFVYWREKPENAVDWHTVGRAEIDALKADITKVTQSIEIIQQKKIYLYRASPSKCRLCDFSTICPAGLIMQSKRKPSFEGVEEDADIGLGLESPHNDQ